MGLQPAGRQERRKIFPINFFVAIFMSTGKKCQEKIISSAQAGMTTVTWVGR
jgi:hypothetical protein